MLVLRFKFQLLFVFLLYYNVCYGAGMVDLSMDITGMLIMFFMLFVFVFVSKKMLFDPVMRVISERNEKLDSDKKSVMEFKLELNRLKDSYELRLAKVKEEIRENYGDVMSKTKRECDNLINRASEEITKDLDNFRIDLASEVEEVEKVLKKDLENFGDSIVKRVLGD